MSGPIPYHEKSLRNRFYITHRKNEEIFNRALLRGAPKQLILYKPFLLHDLIRTTTSTLDGMKAKTVNKNKQIESFKTLYRYPFSNPTVSCIGSDPTDIMASQVALHLMISAINILDNFNSKDKPIQDKEYPLWHCLTGSYQDKLRDSPKKKLSLLILSNVPGDASNVKLEKLRDILELYNDIPRIVVTTGLDPLSFFHAKIHYPVNHIIYLLGSRMRVREI